MGKNRRERRVEERDGYAARNTAQKRKNYAIASGVLGLVVVLIGITSYNFVTMESGEMGAPDGAGRLGGEHEHASILVKIFGDNFDFTAPTYQIKSSWIHFEESDGKTVHRHASGVTIGYLFETLNIGIDEKCYTFPDGRNFCNVEDKEGDQYTLKFYINHEKVTDIRNHVLNDGDRILISYGNESQQQIDEQLIELDSQIIKS